MPTTYLLNHGQRPFAAFALIACFVSACAGTPTDNVTFVANPAAPINDEVVEYVQTHWSSYAERVLRFQHRPRNEEVSLVGMRDVSCGEYYGIPECSFTVTVSIDGGSPIDQRLLSLFDRDPDGKLFETIVFIHERRR